MHAVYVSYHMPRCSSMLNPVLKVFSAVNVLTLLFLRVCASIITIEPWIIDIPHNPVRVPRHVRTVRASKIQALLVFLLTTPQKRTCRLQIMILAILATRMHLHLWHAEQHRYDYDSENLLPIPMSHVPESNI
jgi:hypothetical protein